MQREMIAMGAFGRRLTALSRAIIGVACAGLLATACTSASRPAATTTVTVTPPAATKTVTAAPTTTPSGPGPCPTSELRLAVGRQNGRHALRPARLHQHV